MTASNHVLFWLSYKHNRPLLRKKGDFFKEWYDWFHNPRKKIVKRVGDKGQDEKMRWTITETDKGKRKYEFFFVFFSSHNSRKSRHATWIENGQRFAIHSFINFDTADWWYQTHVKNYRNIIRLFNKDFPALLRAGNRFKPSQFI